MLNEELSAAVAVVFTGCVAFYHLTLTASY